MALSIFEILIFSMLAIFVILFILIAIDISETKHEHYDECDNLINAVHQPTVSFFGPKYHTEKKMCTKYIDENPNATGQDVLDHLNLKIRTVEELVDGPINSNLLDTTHVATRDITDSVTNLPYYKECVELGSVRDISILECMSIVAVNPSYTGQEIIDAVELNKNTQTDTSEILDRQLRP